MNTTAANVSRGEPLFCDVGDPDSPSQPAAEVPSSNLASKEEARRATQAVKFVQGNKMTHKFSGIVAAATLHARSASVHQRAISHRPMSEFGGTKASVNDLAGVFLRAKHTHDILHDVSVDVEIAIRVLKGNAHPDQEVIFDFTELAFVAKSASENQKQTAIAALEQLRGVVTEALAENAKTLNGALSDAKDALVKAIAVGGLNTNTLRHANGAGLQLVEGTLAQKSLPRELLLGTGGLTTGGEKKLADAVMKDYQRELEDQQILRDEFAEHDLKTAKRALENRAKQALKNLGVN